MSVSMRKLVAIAGLATLAGLSGCSLPGKPRLSVNYYVLTDPGPVVAAPATLPGVLLLRDTEVPPIYQDARLAYSRVPGTLGQYQYAQWSEPLPRRLGWILRQRLEAAAVFKQVAPMGSGVLGDFQLNTRLIDFYHDASQTPGVALMVLEAELVQRKTGELINRRIFVAQEPVTAYDAAGAADALGRATNRVMDQIVLWLAQVGGS